ncbi:MAG: penicillin-binding protein activator LpoB [Deltaproteobacteria bacterium RIFOXYD12_FULL_55_16]|nr:MAG: penicillin-binding protein activator LpoB [Deltaproteobacteria bacterium RIFOXYD12_FULL_55_16]
MCGLRKSLFGPMSVFLLLLLFSGGCAWVGNTLVGDTFHDPLMDFASVKTVAVLPFFNLSKDQAAAERARDTFTTMLLADGGIYVVPPGETARGINRVNMVIPSQPSLEEVKKFAGITQVDAVITGVVREYGEVRLASATANVMSLSLQMLDKESGAVVWTGSATRGGISFTDRLFGGGGQPMDEITRRVCQDLLDRLFAVK